MEEEARIKRGGFDIMNNFKIGDKVVINNKLKSHQGRTGKITDITFTGGISGKDKCYLILIDDSIQLEKSYHWEYVSLIEKKAPMKEEDLIL